MKQVLLLVVFAFLSVATCKSASASQIELSKESINRFLSASNELALLKQELPDMQKFSDERAVKTTEQIVAHLQASKAYPQIQLVLGETDFADLHDFFEFSERLMGVRLYLQMENATQATVFQTVEILQANLNSMKANNASKAIIQKAELILRQQRQKAALIEASLDKLTEQDKLFAQKNQQWLAKLFSQ